MGSILEYEITKVANLLSSSFITQGYTYKGSDHILMTGAHQEGTIPAGTKFAHIFSEAGDVRFSINSHASAASPGYIIAGGVAVAYLVSATELSFYGAAAGGVYANVMYYG